MTARAPWHFWSWGTSGKCRAAEARSRTQGSNAPSLLCRQPGTGAAVPAARGRRAGAQWAKPHSSTASQYSLFSLERTLFAVFFMSDISSSSSSFVSGEKEKSEHGCVGGIAKICCLAPQNVETRAASTPTSRPGALPPHTPRWTLLTVLSLEMTLLLVGKQGAGEPFCGTSCPHSPDLPHTQCSTESGRDEIHNPHC